MNTYHSKFNIKSISKIEPNFKVLEENFHTSAFDYNLFSIKKIQSYYPILELFTTLEESNYNNITLNHKYQFLSLNSVFDISQNKEITKNVFIKCSPLINPTKYLVGKYKLDDTIYTLPSLKQDQNEKVNSKILDKNNISYIDNFFCFLCSKLLDQHHFLHGIDYYGSFLGIQEKFKTNISDDLDFLYSYSYFSNNINKLYDVENLPFRNYFSDNSRSNREKLTLTDAEEIDIHMDELEILDLSQTTIESSNEKTLVYENSNILNNSETDTESETSSDNSEIVNSDDDEEDDEEVYTSESDESDETEDSVNDNNENINAYIYDYPIQFICLEKCKGTFDDLLENQLINYENAAAYLMQVIMTLIVLQKTFHFTHNDLHTNNIMYIETDIEFLYYQINNQIYKVPTHGKIFKLIDFGRAIYKYDTHLFCSDSFAPGDDAATQYNFEPYYNEKKPRIEPNMSFDLCRLGCSIFDFIMNDINESSLDPLQETIARWCTDDNGKNVLYKKNGEERYPDFKLYKMIARTVHNHTPQSQLDFPYFSQFLCNTNNKPTINIDSIPSYYK